VIFVKNPEIGRFLFILAHILKHLVFEYLLPEVRTPLTFFFFYGRVCQGTPRLKAHFAKNTTHYLFPEYFQSLLLKNKNQFYKLNTILIQIRFVGKLQIDSNMRPLHFVTFPV
jgi:hypothetical protein